MLLAILVGLAAALGALARYLLDQFVGTRWESAFPWGTWVINVSGSFILGLITGLAVHHGLNAHVVSVLGTGVCGGYTTFSTFNFETIRLTEDGSLAGSLGNIAGSIASGLLAGAAGLGLALLI
ncbi:fluoride efflux transporter CrcB [Actinospica acidithermotolerans]|uniref:fluoride efflux transporter CrcB n=1 Tax=Actinospica acidithermotolerans TaxID=2828514 RepID=UPI002013A2CF|nr:fluoride efflux transporter CrcB [Actinospica acidithermotolerans]